MTSLIVACSVQIQRDRCCRWMRKISCTCKRNTTDLNKLKRQMRGQCDSRCNAAATPLPYAFISIWSCRLTAQLARTEEAAKRAMVARDPSAKGGAAQRLLDVECELSRFQADHTELETKYFKERKRAGDYKTKSEEFKRRLDTVLRDQRQLVQRVGNAEARR